MIACRRTAASARVKQATLLAQCTPLPSVKPTPYYTHLPPSSYATIKENWRAGQPESWASRMLGHGRAGHLAGQTNGKAGSWPTNQPDIRTRVHPISPCFANEPVTGKPVSSTRVSNKPAHPDPSFVPGTTGSARNVISINVISATTSSKQVYQASLPEKRLSFANRSRSGPRTKNCQQQCARQKHQRKHQHRHRHRSKFTTVFRQGYPKQACASIACAMKIVVALCFPRRHAPSQGSLCQETLRQASLSQPCLS